MTQTRKELSRLIDEMTECYPDWRLGQLIVNLANWARDAAPENVWDVEDDELLEAARSHLERRKQRIGKVATEKVAS